MNQPVNKYIPTTIRHKILFVRHLLPVCLDPNQIYLAPFLLTVCHRIRRPYLEALRRKHRIRPRILRRTNPRPPRLRSAGIIQRFCRVPALLLVVSYHHHHPLIHARGTNSSIQRGLDSLAINNPPSIRIPKEDRLCERLSGVVAAVVDAAETAPGDKVENLEWEAAAGTDGDAVELVKLRMYILA